VSDPFDAAVEALDLPRHWSWRVEVRPRRRTVGLEVDPDGSIVFAVPADAEPDAVALVVRSRQLWLARAIGRRAKLAADHPAKEIVNGEGFEYLGRHYRLLLVDDATQAVSLRGGWLQVQRSAEGVGAIIDWYRSRGQHWLADRAAMWAGRLGVQPHEVVVRDLGTSWGVRDKDSRIAFHWAAVQLPPRLLDLIVVHELVHLAVARHDDEFRRRILLALPDALQLEAELAQAGRGVWMGALRRDQLE
jgi:predicted metal-dependent hydrolase